MSHDVNPMASVPECNASWEAALNHYVDGELPFQEQPALFAHLSTCAACRRTLEAVLAFRRMSRQEPLAVPPAADDAVFRRLDQVKQRTERVDREAERRCLWTARAPISLGAAAMVAVVLFVVGLLVPMQLDEVDPSAFVSTDMERVEVEPAPAQAVYVFYPGLTVEATKLEDVAPFGTP
jgi:anti-sigma factor RsiW